MATLGNWQRVERSRSRSRERLAATCAVSLIVSLVFAVAPTPASSASSTVSASLVQVIDTSSFTPASPDPSGVTYLPWSDNLLVVDSEVDETTGAGYHGVNIWQLDRSGTVVATGTTRATGTSPGYSDEPTGTTVDPASKTLFISDDDRERIFVRQPGLDGLFGTDDDVDLGSIGAGDLGLTDAEDPAFITAGVSSGDLFFLDGENNDVYRVDPVDGSFGNADDIVTHFDVGVLGVTNTEALAYDQFNDTLLVGASNGYIYETTLSGGLIRTIDARVPGLTRISGLTMAPASVGSGWNYWIVDRAVSGLVVPTENDGKLFEVAVPPFVGNIPPAVDSVSIDQTAPLTGDTLTAAVDATDPDGDDAALTFDYQWMKNGVDLPSATTATLDLSVAGAGDAGDIISLRVTAFDGNDVSLARTSPGSTVANSSPAFGQDLGNRGDSEGVTIAGIDSGATDPDGDTLTYSATGLPPGIGINPATGQISGTIAAGAAAGSPYTVEVTVADPAIPISLVQKEVAAGSTRVSRTLSWPSRPTEGNLLIAMGLTNTAGGFTMSDGWNLAIQTPGAPQPTALAFYKVAGPNEPSVVSLTNVDGIATNGALSVYEYAGLSNVESDVLDRFVSGAAPAGSTSVSTGSTPVTTVSDELLIAAVDLGAYGNPFLNTWTNSFSQRMNVSRHTVADRIVSATGAYETTESWTGGVPARALLLTFKARDRSVSDTFTWTVTGSGSVSPPPPVDHFTDDNGNLHEANINYIADAGVTFGCNAAGTLFCPDGDVTRGEMASFLARAFQLPPTATDYFPDDNGSLHEANINAIAAAGITVGCGVATPAFCPDSSVTRAEMATFIVRALQLVPWAADYFTDVPAAYPDHGANINALAGHRITAGCTADGRSFCPDDYVRRDEMASFLARAMQLGSKRAPVATITNPSDSATIPAELTAGVYSATVPFSSTAIDVNGGPLTASWRSPEPGSAWLADSGIALGTGFMTTVSLSIPVGEQLSLRRVQEYVSDSDGLFSMDQILIKLTVPSP